MKTLLVFASLFFATYAEAKNTVTPITTPESTPIPTIELTPVLRVQHEPRSFMYKLRDVILGEEFTGVEFGGGWISTEYANAVSYPGFKVESSKSDDSQIEAFINYFPSTKIAFGVAVTDERITNELKFYGTSLDQITIRSPITVSAKYYPFGVEHVLYGSIGAKMLVVDGHYQYGGNTYENYGTGFHRILAIGGDVPFGKVIGFDFGMKVEYQFLNESIESPIPDITSVTFSEQNKLLISATFGMDLFEK